MKLHSPQFEKTLRRGVKDAIRRSPELKKEARQANKFRKHYKTSPVVRIFIVTMFGFAVGGLADVTKHPVTALAAVNLWTFVWIFFRVQHLIICLYHADDLVALSLLPAPRNLVFRWELQKFYRASLMSFLDLLAGFGAVAWLQRSEIAMIAVVPAAILGWLTLLAAVMLCASRFPRLPYSLISALFLVGGFALYIVGLRLFGPLIISTLERCAPTINILIPTGWIPSVFLLFTGHYEWTPILLLIPVAALICTMPNSLTILRERYTFTENIRREVSDIVPDEPRDINSDDAEFAEEKPVRLDTSSIEDIIRTRLFSLATMWGDRGWFENKLWRWLTPRERTLADFAFPHGISIWPGWKNIFRNLGIAFLITLAAGYINPASQVWLLFIGLFITACQVLVRITSNGEALRSIRSSGMNTPLYVGYAVGFRELSHFLSKYSLIQVPFVALFALLYGALVAFIFRQPIAVGLVIGFKATGFIVAFRYLLLTLSFSSGASVSNRLTFRNFATAICQLGLGISFVFLAIGSLLVENDALAWGLWTLALVSAYIFFAFYGWYYRWGKFDLMNFRRK